MDFDAAALPCKMGKPSTVFVTDEATHPFPFFFLSGIGAWNK
jgi:hypothetical protein